MRPTVVRYDLPWSKGERPATAVANLRQAPVDAQPTSTVLVSLLGQEDRLLARMKPKTRHNIRLAHRRGVGVTVTRAAVARGAALAAWYRLYRETARRHRISAHSERDFATLLELAATVTAPELFLLSAFSRDELLGGIIVSVCGRMARYLYGASTPRGRELMANYALQWEAMRVARAHRCLTYDLHGNSDSPGSAPSVGRAVSVQDGVRRRSGTPLGVLGSPDEPVHLPLAAPRRAAEPTTVSALLGR